MSAHTPTPWFISRLETKQRGLDIIADDVQARICSVPLNEFTDNTVRRSNAAFIVRACNSHDALVAALELFRKAGVGNSTDFDIQAQAFNSMLAALALAKGEA